VACIRPQGRECLHSVADPVLLFFLLYNFPPARGFGAGSSSVVIVSLLDAPVKHVVILISLSNKEVAEELAEVGVVRLVIEAQCACVIKENTEFVRKAAAKKIGGSGHFLFHDTVVLLLLCGRLETLPRQSSSQEVHEDVSKRLEVISTSLLNAQVGVD